MTDKTMPLNNDESKTFAYREMLTKTGSSAWRGAARSKLADRIKEGSSKELSLSTASSGSNHAPGSEGLSGRVCFAGQELSSNLLEDVHISNASRQTQEADSPPNFIVGVLSDAPASDNITVDMDESEEDAKWIGVRDDLAGKVGETNDQVDGNMESGGDDDDDAKQEGQIFELPVIYLNWEPKPEDDDEMDMEDIELGTESEPQKHSGEVNMDKGAFERLRAMEVKRRKRQRKQGFLLVVNNLLTVVIIVLLAWGFIALFKASKSDRKTEDTINTDSSSEEHSIVQAQEQLEVAASGDYFTGRLAPLQGAEISNNGNDHLIAVQFPANAFVPPESDVVFKVYDGPNCSSNNGEEKEITGLDNYVKAGLYSAGAAYSTGISVKRMGLLLQWDSTDVEDSPLYTKWHLVGEATHTGSSFDQFSTMDLCVSLNILDSTGVPVHNMETHISTSWNKNVLEKVQTVPIIAH